MTASPDGQLQKPHYKELQAEIERDREQLGETIEALTARLDVKTRTKERLNEAKERAAAQLDAGRIKALELTRFVRNAATDEQGKPIPAAFVGAAVAASALVAITVVARRRRR